MTSYTRSLLQTGIRSQRIQFVSKLELMHKYLQSAAKAQLPEYTIAQSPRDTVAQSPRDTKSETPRSSSWAIFCVVYQRVVFFLVFFLSGLSTNELSGSADQRVVRVGGPNVTAACLYPALRLDKLYAALIRCLVLWTVTKQFLVSYFKGLYLLTGGSDVTRGIACDSSVH